MPQGMLPNSDLMRELELRLAINKMIREREELNRRRREAGLAERRFYNDFGGPAPTLPYTIHRTPEYPPLEGMLPPIPSVDETDIGPWRRPKKVTG